MAVDKDRSPMGPIIYRHPACGALFDSRDLLRSKLTQKIVNGTKHKLIVTYMELNDSKMSKTQ